MREGAVHEVGLSSDHAAAELRSRGTVTLQAPAPAPDDSALLLRIADGDRAALGLLFRRHNVRVYRFVLRIVGDAAEAEDLMAEVFIEVWRQAARFEARSSVSTWMLAIARLKAISFLRLRPVERLHDDAARAIEDLSDTPEIAMQKIDRRRCLQQCLRKLSRPHREVVDLVYYHERSIKEVADILAIPAGTVKTRMWHARRRLAELLRAAGVDTSWS
jgi:RNA polymerase sigma-70 factor (ECF subfamily)